MSFSLERVLIITKNNLMTIDILLPGGGPELVEHRLVFGINRVADA
jgi:hypothetical protein